jgi:cobalt-zinc-cadmium efflux system outer membrane protein
MQSPLPLSIITILLLISGCVGFEDHPLNPVLTAVRIETRSLSNPELQQFIVSIMGQKKSWNVDSLTLAAIYYHADVALAQAIAETAAAAITTAGQRPNPSINISPTWISNLATTAMPWIFANSLNIPIETANKRELRVSKSEHVSAAASLRVVDAVWQVRGRLRLALLEVYAAREAERLLQQQLQIQQEIAERMALQLSAGEIARDDINRVHIALNQLQINVAAAQKRVAESRVLLATAIGVPVATLSGIEFDFSQFVQPFDLLAIPVARLRITALHQRPDILAALADYAAAQSALQLEYANQYPNIQANPSYTWELGENRWSLGATALQLPIFHQNQGQIGEAEAKRAESAVRFDALQLRILGEIDKGRAGITAVASKWQAAEQQQRDEQKHIQSVQDLLQAGETDALALLTAKLESTIAERAKLDVLVENQQTVSLLEDTLRYPIASTLTADSMIQAIRKTSP